MNFVKGASFHHFSRARMYFSCLLILVTGGLLGFAAARAAETNPPPATVELKLQDYLQQVLQHNESIQAQMLEAEVNRRKSRGEYGVFEPNLVVSAMREANQRTNNIQQQAQQSGESFFSEQNNIYNGGLESLMPTGGKIRLGYTLSDLGNNVNPYGIFGTSTNQIWTKEYQTFVGLSFSQPLLKNAGFTPTLAAIRLAAFESEIAFQQYRRQLMLTLYQAEAAYWNLYYAQEQIRFFDESVGVAQSLLNDSREKFKAGQGAELDVLEAQSALALRNTKRNDALQNYFDALGRLQSLAGGLPDLAQRGFNSLPIRVVDAPEATNAPPVYADCIQEIFTLNPDYLIQLGKVNQEGVRLGFAKNQLLPELNFKGAYGFNGLGNSPEDSWDVATTKQFPSWSIGLELTIPLAGNIKGRHNYKAASLSLQEAYLSLKGTQTEISFGVNTAVQKAGAWEQSIQSYKMVVQYNEELLKTQLERLKAGRVDGHKVLEVEADLLDARQECANALTQYQRALLQVELTDGALLKHRRLEVTQEELKRQTTALLAGRRAVDARILGESAK